MRGSVFEYVYTGTLIALRVSVHIAMSKRRRTEPSGTNTKCGRTREIHLGFNLSWIGMTTGRVGFAILATKVGNSMLSA